jgi:hypothetical protein
MQHIFKTFASVFLSSNDQQTPLDSLKFETSLVTILSFVGQNNIAKIELHCETEQLAKNKREFDFINTHCKALKTTIEGLGMITGMVCILKICANICCIITALFHIDGNNPVPILYSVCIKTIDFVNHLDLIQWHASVRNCIPQLPFIFLNMLQQVLSQSAIFSTNNVNIGLIECGNNGVNLNTAQLSKVTKLVSHFFECMDNHILEGSYPDTVPAFTPRDANPNHQIVSVIAMVDAGQHLVAEKSKMDVSPPGTPATKKRSKRQKLKVGAGLKDFTKAGLFHCKEGTSIFELFPFNLTKN